MAALQANPAGQVCDDGPVEDIFQAASQVVSEAVDLADDLADHIRDHLESLGFGSTKRKYPLHEPTSCEDFRKALEKGETDHNSLNSEENAPIHSLIKKKARGKKRQREKMRLLVTLLTFGDVDIDMLNGDGYTALHLAVKMGDTKIIKVLIAFGADINASSSSGQTPFSLLSGPHQSQVNALFLNLVARKPVSLIESTKKMRRVDYLAIGSDVEQRSTLSLSPEMVNKVTTMLLSAGAEEKPVVDRKRFRASPAFARSIYLASRAMKKPSSESPEIRYQYYYLLRDILMKRLSNIADLELSHSPEDSAYLLEHMKEARLLQMAGSSILFLDGGGMRGLMQLEILCQLEERTGRSVTELFDWIVGTSTGGLLALALVYGKKTLSEMRKFFFKAREDVFMDPQGGIKFDSDGLESMLKEISGDLKMCDVKHPRVVVTATYKKTANLKLHLFSNVTNDDEKKSPVFINDEYVWEVARYTSAAPIYFTEFKDYVDGGILAQNPSAVGLTAIQKHFNESEQQLPISLVVSIGTGKVSEESAHIGDIDATEVLVFGKQWLSAVRGLSDRIKSLSTLLSNAITESEIVSENCRFRCKEQGVPYYRFNPIINEDIPPGETDLAILVDMMMNARCYTVANLDFHKLVLSFDKIKACRKLLSPSYSEKMKKLLTSSYKK